MLISYSQQLTELADKRKVDLLCAVRNAGIDDTTYYRSIKGPRSLHFATAGRIADAIMRLAQQR